jgi:hypothetical protein
MRSSLILLALLVLISAFTVNAGFERKYIIDQDLSIY